MKKKSYFRFPISIKLVVVTTVLMLAVAVPIAFQSSNRFESISIDREEDKNRGQASTRAAEVESLLISYIDKIKVVAGLLTKDFSSENEKKNALDLSFNYDRDLVVVEVLKRGSSWDAKRRVVKEDFFKQYGKTSSYVDSLRRYQKKYKTIRFAASFAGEIEVRNSSVKEGVPLLSITLPLIKDSFGKVTHIAVGEIRLDRLQKVFANIGETEMFLVDRDGRTLAAANEELVLSAQSRKNIPIVGKSLESVFKEGQQRYSVGEKKYTGAFARTALGPVVISQASQDVILEAAYAVKREAFYIAGRVLSIALFLIFVFSITLTSPIEKLVEVTKRIGQGEFDVETNISSRDEVGELAKSVDMMASGLRERDKMKNVLNKFHGSSVADDILNSDLELGGSRKDVTVFFSDIRGFTKFSEGHSPEEVVSMLNEYFEVMVSIITKNNGVVDKFIGDAIMAVWGAPNPTEQDAENAVRACIEMRIALDTLNKKRREAGKSAIMIGMGLHSGDAISGTIGSDERMEYTVIGDTVNQSSRIEASTKAFGSDLLLSDTTAELVKENFLLERAGAVEVKGKSEPLVLYKVRGYLDEEKNEVIVQTEYSDYEAEKADKVKMAS